MYSFLPEIANLNSAFPYHNAPSKEPLEDSLAPPSFANHSQELFAQIPISVFAAAAALCRLCSELSVLNITLCYSQFFVWILTQYTQFAGISYLNF